MRFSELAIDTDADVNIRGRGLENHHKMAIPKYCTFCPNGHVSGDIVVRKDITNLIGKCTLYIHYVWLRGLKRGVRRIVPRRRFQTTYTQGFTMRDEINNCSQRQINTRDSLANDGIAGDSSNEAR